MIQFYSPEIRNDSSLGGEESSHCTRVLRKRIGDIIYVTDGRGMRYECRITDASSRCVRVEIINETLIPRNWNFKLTLAVAPTKNADRMAWLVEKATEIGVNEISFIDCKFGERKKVNLERLRRNALSAMNQSLKTWLPDITEMKPLDSILLKEGEKFFGYCNNEMQRLSFVTEYNPNSDVVIAIGPEGDFSHEEVEKLVTSGFKAVTFGDERLRTETAALYAVTSVHVVNTLRLK